MKLSGRKEVAEAVVIAALCSLATGTISWGFEEAKRKLWELRKKRKKGAKRLELHGCDVPPPGWHCTRAKGHEGPCAAVPSEPAEFKPPWGEKR